MVIITAVLEPKVGRALGERTGLGDQIAPGLPGPDCQLPSSPNCCVSMSDLLSHLLFIIFPTTANALKTAKLLCLYFCWPLTLVPELRELISQI